MKFFPSKSRRTRQAATFWPKRFPDLFFVHFHSRLPSFFSSHKAYFLYFLLLFFFFFLEERRTSTVDPDEHLRGIERRSQAKRRKKVGGQDLTQAALQKKVNRQIASLKIYADFLLHFMKIHLAKHALQALVPVQPRKLLFQPNNETIRTNFGGDLVQPTRYDTPFALVRSSNNELKLKHFDIVIGHGPSSGEKPYKFFPVPWNLDLDGLKTTAFTPTINEALACLAEVFEVFGVDAVVALGFVEDFSNLPDGRPCDMGRPSIHGKGCSQGSFNHPKDGNWEFARVVTVSEKYIFADGDAETISSKLFQVWFCSQQCADSFRYPPGKEKEYRTERNEKPCTYAKKAGPLQSLAVLNLEKEAYLSLPHYDEVGEKISTCDNTYRYWQPHAQLRAPGAITEPDIALCRKRMAPDMPNIIYPTWNEWFDDHSFFLQEKIAQAKRRLRAWKSGKHTEEELPLVMPDVPKEVKKFLLFNKGSNKSPDAKISGIDAVKLYAYALDAMFLKMRQSPAREFEHWPGVNLGFPSIFETGGLPQLSDSSSSDWSYHSESDCSWHDSEDDVHFDI